MNKKQGIANDEGKKNDSDSREHGVLKKFEVNQYKHIAYRIWAFEKVCSALKTVHSSYPFFLFLFIFY